MKNFNFQSFLLGICIVSIIFLSMGNGKVENSSNIEATTRQAGTYQMTNMFCQNGKYYIGVIDTRVGTFRVFENESIAVDSRLRGGFYRSGVRIQNTLDYGNSLGDYIWKGQPK